MSKNLTRTDRTIFFRQNRFFRQRLPQTVQYQYNCFCKSDVIQFITTQKERLIDDSEIFLFESKKKKYDVPGDDNYRAVSTLYRKERYIFDVKYFKNIDTSMDHIDFLNAEVE